MRLLVVVGLLGTLAAVMTSSSQELQCQVVNGLDNPENIQCLLDDFVTQYIQPASNILTVGGACPVRDEAYALSPATSPGINVSFSSLQNDLTAPFCIGILTDIAATNTAPILTFSDANLANVGNVTLTTTGLSVSVRGTSAAFDTDATGQKNIQLCSDGSNLQLYKDCNHSEVASFGEISILEGDQIGIYKDLADSSSEPFLNSVTQLYLLSCTGPGVLTQDIVDLQCQANPQDCNDNATALPVVVETFERKLKEALPTPTTVCSSVVLTTVGSLGIPTKVGSSVLPPSTVTTSSATSPTPVRKEEDDDGTEEGKELFVAGLVLTIVGSFFLIISALLLIVGVVLIVWHRRSAPTESYNLQENGSKIHEKW